MPDDLKVDKDKFDALLRKVAKTPALTPEQKKVGPKPGIIYRSRKKAKPEK